MSKFIKEKSKDKILHVSKTLFSSHGINTIGVDRICAEANVSKRTLYKHFPSKEALVSAAIASIGQEWLDACINADSKDPAERILHVFKMVEPMAKVKDFYGCILMNTSIELRGTDDLAIAVARDFKSKLYTYFEEQGTQLGVEDPRVLAQQLIVLYDGTNAWIVMRREFPTSTFLTLDMLLR